MDDADRDKVIAQLAATSAELLPSWPECSAIAVAVAWQRASAGDWTTYAAEISHQQYLARNINGYRCHSTTGVPYPTS